MSGFTKYNQFTNSFTEDASSEMRPITEAERMAALQQLDDLVNETRESLTPSTTE
jgi:hypothetical protein